MELKELWRRDLASASAPLTWIWHGLLSPGQITLLTSQWKTGKTTLVSLLLARRVSGGQLAGQAVAAGGTAIVSEESATLWDRRAQLLDPGQRVCFFCRPFGGKPRMEQWQTLLDR